jgi:hypothetical protein
MWVMNDIDLPDADSPRPNLANIPSMDDMLALYEKVLSELDSAISTQKDFAKETASPGLSRDWANDILDK